MKLLTAVGIGGRRLRGAGVLASVLLVLASVGAGRAAGAAAATLTVCPSGCPYTQIAPALAAARNGDTIEVAAGTYRGGLTIGLSVKLVGAGAGATIISGGGTVLTIGALGSASEPTVSISGVTITGGVTHSSPESVPFTGQEGVFAVGGGVEIPPKALFAGGFAGGATVTITKSVITGNSTAPSTSLPSGFAFAGGAGVDNWGTLTLTNTTVSDNQAGGPVASDASGAGIQNWRNLTLITTGWRALARHLAIARLALDVLPPQRLRQAHQAALDPLRRLIARGQHTGEFRDDQPAEWMVTVLYALLHAAADDVTSGRLHQHSAANLIRGSALSAFRPHHTTHTTT